MRAGDDAPARRAASSPGPPSALRALNEASGDDAFDSLLACCGSRRWAREMVERRPFADIDALAAAADEVWWDLDPADWLEAFAAHPRIGERGGSGSGGQERAGAAPGTEEGARAAPGTEEGAGAAPGTEDGARAAPGTDRAAAWSRAEQAGARDAGGDTLRALEEGNRRYEERFGHVFLIRAAGRSAVDMLGALTERMSNEPEAELRVAAAQQAEITRLRLAKLAEGT